MKTLEIISNILSVFLGGSVTILIMTFVGIPDDMLRYLKLGVYIVAIIGSILVMNQRYKYFKKKKENEELKKKETSERFIYHKDYSKEKE